MACTSRLVRTVRNACAMGAACIGLIAASLSAHALPVTVSATVPGTSNPWLAGMPDGATASSGDSAPAHSPVLVSGLDLGAGGALTFANATGGVRNEGGCPPSCFPIDGLGFTNHFAGAENGISDVRAPVNALLGVFLGDAQPDLSAAPGGLDFQAIGLDFLTLSPALKQVFFIGDGRTGANLSQQFIIPDGATRFFLGTMDGFGWFNNTGSIGIDVTQIAFQEPPVGVPEPGTLALLAAAFSGMTWARQRRT